MPTLKAMKQVNADRSITVPLALHELVQCATAEGRNGWFRARSAEVHTSEKFTPASNYTEAFPVIRLWVWSPRSIAATLELSVADARALADALKEVADYAETNASSGVTETPETAVSPA